MLIARQVKTEPGDYRGFYANVRDAMLGRAPLAVTPEDGYRTIRLLELARESSPPPAPSRSSSNPLQR